jgi:hypothetical protein
MTERKADYTVGRITQLTTGPVPLPKTIELIDAPAPPPRMIRVCAPPPDMILTVLERIRDLCDAELARIERHGGCCRFALDVRTEVGRVLK